MKEPTKPEEFKFTSKTPKRLDLSAAPQPSMQSLKKEKPRKATGTVSQAGLSTEDLLLQEIKAKGQFKALPLNREIFKPVENTIAIKPETTKPEAFNLSKPKTPKRAQDEQPREAFKALPLKKSILDGVKGRLSVPPPSLTHAIGFNLNTERRGQLIPRKRLHIEEPPAAFKARKMPQFLKPSSPTRSTKSTDFKCRYCHTNWFRVLPGDGVPREEISPSCDF